ncbi:MAG: B12-binding domain-containing radical SAM protein, partial [Methanosarcinales archaeon]
NKIIITKPRKFITNLDKHRMDWSLIDIKKYLGKEKLWGCKRVLPYVTSRGCPYNCAFCYNLIFNKRIWRCHSVKHVVEDIQFLKDTYNIDGIKIFDDNFFVNMKRAFNIIEAIKLPWHCELRADVVTKKVAKKLQQTNAKELLIGAETGSERLMQLINKGLTVNTVMKCVKNLSKIDAFPVYSFIVGLPTETWEETQLTIDMILKIHEIDPKAMFTVGPFNPYPNNPLYDLAIKLGFKPPEKTEDWSIIERWEGNFDLTWLPWGDKKLFLLIRDYSKFLYFGTNYNIPFLERIAKYRLSRRNFSFTLEHKLIKLAYKNFRELI